MLLIVHAAVFYLRTMFNCISNSLHK